MTTGSPDELYRRYLGILGWVGDPGLHELVSSHLIKVPYENVSTLLRSAGSAGATTLTPIGDFLEDIAERDLGGNGYSIPIHFASLLQFLDYEVELLGADIGGTPRAHAVCRVRSEDTDYLVDIGHGAPFYQPIPLDTLPVHVPHGDYQYVIDRHGSGPGAIEVTTLRTGSKVQSYVAKPPALAAEGFASAIAQARAADARTLRTLRISRFFASRVLEIFDNHLVTTHHNITTVTPIRDIEELEAIVRDQLQLVRCPVRQAVDILRSRGVDIFANSAPPTP
jgi:arylamine N-acetyltransferase